MQLRWFPLKRQKSILVWEDWKRVVSKRTRQALLFAISERLIGKAANSMTGNGSIFAKHQNIEYDGVIYKKNPVLCGLLVP